MLGDVIWEDLSECLIKNCLVYSIPTNSSKLQQYEEVRAEMIAQVLGH
jgi:centromere/kinetochore protein ZW10